MSSYRVNHIQQLESEAIFVLREVAAQFDNPVMMFSGGKDSIVMAHLASKAFHPADFANLQNELPENVLNEIELFLFGVNQNATIDNVKES